MAIARRWQTEPGLASGRGSPGVLDALDPIDAAQSDIAGSKDLIASINDDINQHNRWLETYHSDERKHARRVRRQEVLYQAERHSRRFADVVKRVAQFLWRWTRTIALFLWVPAKAAFVSLSDLVSRGIAWLTPYAQTAVTVAGIALVWLALEFRALLLTATRWSAKALSWLGVKGGALARETAKATSIASISLYVNLRILARQSRRALATAWLWSRIHGGRLARASAYAASSAIAWLTMNGRTLAFDLRSRLSTPKAWIGINLSALNRKAFATATAVTAWINTKSRELSRAWNRPASQANIGPVTHQALAPKPSTALALIEPPRTALPVVQDTIQRQPPVRPKEAKKAKKVKKAKPSKRRSASRSRRVSSHAGRASP